MSVCSGLVILNGRSDTGGAFGRLSRKRIPIRDKAVQRRQERFRRLFPCEQLGVVNPARASLKIGRIRYQALDNVRHIAGIRGIEIFAARSTDFGHRADI